jgi:hypothetical protein
MLQRSASVATTKPHGSHSNVCISTSIGAGTLFAQTAFFRRSTGKRCTRCHALEYAKRGMLRSRSYDRDHPVTERPVHGKVTSAVRFV